MTATDMIEAVGAAIGRFQQEVDGKLAGLVEGFGKLERDLAARIAALPAPADGRPGAKGDKGDRGEAGADGTSLEFCGTWDAALLYRRGDIVAWEGASWGCKAPTEAGEAPGACDHWEAIALRGNRGKQGEKGERGAKGDRGDRGEPGRAVTLAAVRLDGVQLIMVDDLGNVFAADMQPLMQQIARDLEQMLQVHLDPLQEALRHAGVM